MLYIPIIKYVFSYRIKVSKIKAILATRITKAITREDIIITKRENIITTISKI